MAKRKNVWAEWGLQVFYSLILAGTAYYFAHTLSPVLTRWIPTTALIVGGLYLGVLSKVGEKQKNFVFFKRLFGIALIVAGLMIPVQSGKKSLLVWEPYTAEKVKEAKAAAQPVMIDFYANWCIPCHELEEFTYSDPEVAAALEGFKKLKVDLSMEQDPGSVEIVAQYDVMGLPTVLFLDRKGEEVREARITGFIPPKELLAILNSPRLKVKS